MKNTSLYYTAWVFIFSLALLLRLPYLNHRPMHTDEAVHALKFADLLETGTYHYDANEYHGPTLNIFTLLPAYLRGQTNLAEIDETTLRLVPVFFGVMLVLILALFSPLIGRTAALASALWITISPAQVYFSRYYIQEILFVFFTFLLIIAVFRYALHKRVLWSLLAGCALGWLHATKETDILVLAAMVAAGLAVWFYLNRSKILAWPKEILSMENRKSINSGQAKLSINKLHMLLFLLSAAVSSAVFFTSLQGWFDSFRTYGVYFQRGAGATLHIQPWYYYLQLLFFHQPVGCPLSTEGWILPFAFIGVIQSFRRSSPNNAKLYKGLRLFLVFFTFALALILFAIPYKTPWNILTVHAELLILAGIGLDDLATMMKKNRGIIIGLVVIAFGMMTKQALSLNHRYDCHPCNPWVYAHPGADVAEITHAVEKATSVAEGQQTFIQVIVPGHEYWPLPWTLRRFTHIGWYDHVDEYTPAAPIILIAPQEEAGLIHKLYHSPPPGERFLYLPLWREYRELRPGVEIRGYVRKDIWEAMP